MLSPKDSVSYISIRPTLRPLDLIMFKGSDFVSNFICYLETMGKSGKDIDISEFSHCGLIVTSDILEHPNVYPGKIYIWESTMSGYLGSGVPNIDGKSFFGSQLRDLDLLLPAYVSDLKSEVAVCPLSSPLPLTSEIKEKFGKIFQLYNSRHYDDNLITLLASIVPFFRRIRSFFQRLLGTEKWLFCSELVTHVYQDLGIFPTGINPENVTPMDLLGNDPDSEVPIVVDSPIYVNYVDYQIQEKEKDKEIESPISNV